MLRSRLLPAGARSLAACRWLPLAVALSIAAPAWASDGWAPLHAAVQRFRVGDHAGLADELVRIEKQTKIKDVAAVAAHLQARVLAATRQGKPALDALGRAKVIRQVSAEAAQWAEIEALVAAGKAPDALAKLAEYRKAYKTLRWAAADLLYSRLYEQVGPPETAAEVALQLYDKSHLHLPRDELLARAARLLQSGQPQRARELWRKLLLRHPESDSVAEASRQVDPATLSDADKFDRVERLFARRAYERCREAALELWQKGHRKSELGYYLGKIGSERLRDDYPGAARYFEAAIPDGEPLAQLALASYAIVLSKLGRIDDSVKAFDTWLQRYPTASLDRRIEVHYDRARALHVAGRSVQAAQDLAAVLEVNRGGGIDWGKYWWFVGYWYYRGGELKKAVEAMKPLLGASNPLVGGKARYWTARCLDKLDKRTEAIEILAKLVRDMPLTYYAALAEDRLREWGAGQRVPRWPDLSKVARRPHDPFQGMPDTAEVRRLRMAVYLGDTDTAELVFDAVKGKILKAVGKARFARFEQDLADPLERFARPREIAYGKWRSVLRKLPTAATVEQWRAIYPRAYRTHVVAAARRHGAPEWMVYAHMLQESRYKPWLISGAPAYGLLELLDRTALRLAREATEDYQLWMLMVPTHNVRWGTQYLGGLYKKFKQQLPFAIASYNGGPMLLEYHMKVAAEQKLPFDEMVDDMGPHECRNYVRMVIGHFLRYLAIYETPKRAAELRAQLLPAQWRNDFLEHPDY